MILSLVNVKGGVGKTTTAVNLSATFAASDLKALLIDLDPQGSASFSLGVLRDDDAPSLADVLLGGAPVRSAVRPSDVPGLDLLAGSIGLDTVAELNNLAEVDETFELNLPSTDLGPVEFNTTSDDPRFRARGSIGLGFGMTLDSQTLFVVADPPDRWIRDVSRQAGDL